MVTSKKGKSKVVSTRRGGLRRLLTAIYDGSESEWKLLASLPDWDKLAQKVMTFWEIPSEITTEDLKQVMLFAVYKKIKKYDPSRGKPIDEFAVFQAMTAAKNEVNRARFGGKRPHRGESDAPSTFDLPFTQIAAPDAEGTNQKSTEPVLMWNGEVKVPSSLFPQADDALHQTRMLKQARSACIDARELISIQALELAGGSVTGAAFIIYDDKEARRICRLNSEEEALRVVKKAMRDVFVRMECLGT